ncbi:MAG: ROK family protein [Acidobacteriota bacterium]
MIDDRWRGDPRIVLTLDAGGTHFVFGALVSGRPVVEPVRAPAHGDDLARCLASTVRGFEKVRAAVGEPAAISFAFPGPADYRAGVIGDLGNLPAFRGGVALGPMLEDHFGIPVFINNDGDLFAYGEAAGGLLPAVNAELVGREGARRYRNLVGVTLGTGFGAGLVHDGRLFLGDNGAGMEVWCTSSRSDPDRIVEAELSARGLRRFYAEEAGVELAGVPEPAGLDAVAGERIDGDRAAAVRAFERFGVALGDALAQTVCLSDSLVVIGGGLARAHPRFLDVAVARMNEPLRTALGDPVPRMEVSACNLENESGRSAFLKDDELRVVVPGSKRTVEYWPQKRVGVGVSRLGTSEAVALGAFVFAVERLDASGGEL